MKGLLSNKVRLTEFILCSIFASFILLHKLFITISPIWLAILMLIQSVLFALTFLKQEEVAVVCSWLFAESVSSYIKLMRSMTVVSISLNVLCIILAFIFVLVGLREYGNNSLTSAEEPEEPWYPASWLCAIVYSSICILQILFALN